jgi:hypothetical protein
MHSVQTTIDTMTNKTSGDAAKALVHRDTEEVQGKGHFDVFEELFADNFVDFMPATLARVSIGEKARSSHCFVKSNAPFENWLLTGRRDHDHLR